MVKDWFRDFFTTTAITILLIATVGLLTGDDSVKMASILSATAANVVVHLGLIAIRRISSVYYMVEIAIEFGYVLGVIVLAGFISGWFHTTPVWITLVITIIVFAVACLINVVRINQDINEINKEISLRRR